MKPFHYQLITTLRRISSVSGLITALSLGIMLVLINFQQRIPLYYVCGGLFLGFGVIFVLTALFFMARSILWHIEYKRLRYLFRHYLYALGLVFLALLVLDHIAEGDDSFWRVVMISPVLALGSVYLSGYRLRILQKKPTEVSSDADRQNG